jgi:cyclophilin family peptidyl-prolyl cis-trans isomerase
MSKLSLGRLRRFLGGFAVLATAVCTRGAPSTDAPRDAETLFRTLDPDIDKAEDLRSAKDVPPDAPRSRDPAVRRRAARAFARILDADDRPLLRALEDEDAETIAWAGYGLGESCKGREESHVRALGARLASLDAARLHASPDPAAAIVRALGRCAGELAEQTLRAWLRRGDGTSAAPSRRGQELDRTSAAPPRRGQELDGTSAAPPRRGQELDEAVVYALGEVAAKRGSLAPESAAALLDAAQRAPPLDAALYPFGRVEGPAADPLEPRLVAAARAALNRPGPARIFAVRALGHSARASGAPELARLLASDDFTPSERAEAARALGHLHAAGQTALADALALMLPDGARALAGDRCGLLLAAVTALGDDAPKNAEPALWTLSRIELAPGLPASLARRVSALRCAAAQKLARGAWDSDVLASCDVAGGEAGERARLASLDRGPLVTARRAAWLGLARGAAHLRVREAAVDAIAHHPELGDLARAVLAESLGASEPGLVATAANVVVAHPERVRVLAQSELRAALDPRAPPPTANPVREIDPHIAGALRAAIAHTWPEDLVETRTALVDAALAIGLDQAGAYAQAACRDTNATVRARAARALVAAGDPADCSRPGSLGAPAAEMGRTIARSTRVAFDTDAGALGVSFDPAFAPIAATRFVSLARSGFFDGIAVHRVVPGFVVQFGDRGGDGYGGSGKLLRCETSPAPFAPFDVGVALAGRDTGSSQLFVTLARYPNLDGQYAWVGRADGDWNAVTEGDMVQRARVEE